MIKVHDVDVIATNIPEVVLIKPKVFNDERGFFRELFHNPRFVSIGLPDVFVQDNHSHSSKGVLRGLHYQLVHPQGKLVSVISGEIFDVAVDIRLGSPTFLHWVGVSLSTENNLQLYIPPGFAHGFYVLSKSADVYYKCTHVYVPEDDLGIVWNDHSINIQWPDASVSLSEKDKNQLTVEQRQNAGQLPFYSTDS